MSKLLPACLSSIISLRLFPIQDSKLPMSSALKSFSVWAIWEHVDCACGETCPFRSGFGHCPTTCQYCASPLRHADFWSIHCSITTWVSVHRREFSCNSLVLIPPILFLLRLSFRWGQPRDCFKIVTIFCSYKAFSRFQRTLWLSGRLLCIKEGPFEAF